MLILVVDDDSEDLSLFCEAARSIDNTLEFIIAGNGKEALDLLGRATVMPAYIFLDINMPRMNGKEFLVRIKQESLLKDIPVIMYSTSSQAREIEECYKLGAYDFLIKPPNFQKLVDDLRSVFIEAERVNGRKK